MNFKFGVVGLMAILVMASVGLGQRNFSLAGPVTENFDLLGTATLTVVDNTTIAGLYTRKTGTDSDGPGQNIVVASTGAGANPLNNFYHFGAAASTERAFGGSPEGGAVGDLSWGLRLVNSGVLPITSISVGQTGEYWHYATNPNQITFAYRVADASTDITDLLTGTYTGVAGLTYAPPIGTNPGGTTQGALDGNALGNRQVFTPVNIILSTPLLPGGEIMLRWTLANITDVQDRGLAIDDVVVTAIGASSAPATISGRVVMPNGRAIGRASILVTDPNGETRTFLSNTFGYFNATGLATGQSYVVSVSARGYTFANPSYVVDLSDNIGGLNFVSTR